MAISSDDIEDLAKGPKRVQTNEGTVVERDVDELSKAKVATELNTGGTVPFGIRIARSKPPSALG